MKKVFIYLTVLCMLFSCGGSKEDTNQTENGNSKEIENPAESKKVKEAKQEAPKNLFGEANALQKAEEALKALPQFEGKELKVFQDVHFYADGRIKLSLQDPNKPENIDHYEYNKGQWNEPIAVQISGGGDLDDNLFPLNEISFATVATIFKNWNEKAQEVEAKKPLNHIWYSLWVPKQTKKWKTSDIEGTRAKYEINFNLDGSVKDFVKK